MKTCTKCNQNKDLKDFAVLSTSKDGRNTQCKHCAVLYTQARQKTVKGLVKKIYNNQKMTTGKMGRPTPSYSEEQLFDWMCKHNYLLMWKEWTDSNHDKWLSPSIDRLDNTKSYSLDNIQLVTWRTNLENQKEQNKAGIYLHTNSKAVDQLTLDNQYIRSFPSAAIAGREMVGHNKNISNITAVCHGKWKSAYGYVWRFSDALC